MQKSSINRTIFIVSAMFILGACGLIYSQVPEGGVKPSVITGDVTSVAAHGIVLSTKSGTMNVEFTDKTEFKRVSPENPSLKAATPATSADIGAGDKVMLTGIPAQDGKSMPARSVYLMTKADIAQKTAKDIEQWRTRGISGKVVSVNPATNQVTVQVASLTRNTTLVLTPKEKAKFLRYAPDSIRFDEARTSSISEVQPGDMLRAIGDKSADGTGFAAEEVLSGGFQTIAGTVVTVDGDKGEIVLKELRSKKDITVVVTDASLLKRFPPEMAERMAGSQAAPGGACPPGGNAGQQGEGAPPSGSQGAGQGRGFGGGRGGGVDDMLERFPTITAADLKPGDMIAISSSKGANADRVKAIKLLAGVEPFLRAAQSATGGRQGQGVPGGLSIPGLDGIGFP